MNEIKLLGFQNLTVFRAFETASTTTLSRASENRAWRIWSDFADYLIGVVRQMYQDENDFELDVLTIFYSTKIDGKLNCSSNGRSNILK